jgi:hypothetical protein
VRERVAAVDRADVLLFRAEDFFAADFLRDVGFRVAADFDDDLEDPERSSSRTRRRRAST